MESASSIPDQNQRLFVSSPDKPKEVKVVGASSRNVARKKLADISNFPQQQPRKSTQDENSHCGSSTLKEYMEQLQKENMALMKMLAERNKIIELTGTELQKLRLNLQKMRQQNLQLAQSNSQMLAELNSSKDRLKELQHELGCINSLAKAKSLEEEEKLKVNIYQSLGSEVVLTKTEYSGESTMGGDDDKQIPSKKKTRSKSLGPSRQVKAKDKTGSKRTCVRRQSARFKSEELECREDPFEIDNLNFSCCPATSDSVPENGVVSTSASVGDEDKERNAALSHEPQEFGRSSLGRPSRQAAKKVQSYKEIPLNVKMRRK